MRHIFYQYNITLISIAMLFSLSTLSVFAHQSESLDRQSIRTQMQDLLKRFNYDEKHAFVETFDSEKRQQWHYVPKSRNGLPLKDMSQEQRDYVLGFLSKLLSQQGFNAATIIMDLESILKQEELFPFRRDPLGYYLEVFGSPTNDSVWGVSFEGHHLSLNYIVKENKVVSFSPLFFGANPAEVMEDYGIGPKKGTRPLKELEDLAFKALNDLNDIQIKVAIVSDEPLRDIVAGGLRAVPEPEKKGIHVNTLSKSQQENIKRLILSYLSFLPTQMQAAIQNRINEDYTESYFAWYGHTEPGIGHYYRIDHPKFLIELANTQSDVSGNSANHVHALWMTRETSY